MTSHNQYWLLTNKGGEQPLAPYDSCRLGSMNLFSFVKNPYTDQAYFDLANFYEETYKAMIFMDNIVDCEIGYLNRIIDSTDIQFKKDLWSKAIAIAKQGRRIGLGFTALGDAIAALGLNFKDSDSFVKGMMHIKMMAELDSTIDMGILKGSFESFDINKEYDLTSNLITRGKNDYFKFIEKEYPEIISRMVINNARRNVSTGSIAPTGSLSILASRMGTTSGIEPLFKALYTRRRKVSSGEKYDFKDPYTGELFMEFFIAHGGLIKYAEIVHGINFNDLSKEAQIKMFESSPYYKNQSEDIAWQDRLKIQSIIQQYTSSAISTTINLPEDVSVDTIKNIYINAYSAGNKGVTVYRENSRSGVLVDTTTKTKEMLSSSDAPKRPNSLPCDIHLMRYHKKNYMCCVGKMNDLPYEIFVFENNIDGYVSDRGYINKVKSGVYQLLDANSNVLIEDLSQVMEPSIEDLTRGYSYGLRHSGQIKFAVEQLQKSKGTLSDFSKILARTLKKYIKDGDTTGEKCPECGNELIFENGCKICKNCGNSKCG